MTEPFRPRGIAGGRRERRRPPAGTVPVAVTAADGVRLAGLRHPGGEGAGTGLRDIDRQGADDDQSGRPAGPAPTFVIAHGFTHDTRAPATRRVIAMFARHGAVVALDFRGHGRSGGRSSVGRDETLDLDAAVALGRRWRAGPVVVVGFSLGAAVALRHAAIGAERPDAVVAVSAPSRWYLRSTGAMRRVHWLLEHPAGPLVGRVIGVRLGSPWPEVPATPLELVGQIPPRPLLLVHGDADPYFGIGEALALHRASGGAGPLWIEAGMGHAETATTRSLVDRIAGWARSETGEAPRDP